MLTDAEIDALAKETLFRVLQDLSGVVPSDFFQPYQLEDGELVAVYAGTSESGYGSFSCQVIPYEAARKIIIHCDRTYDEFLETMVDSDSRDKFEEQRQVAVKGMGDCAILHLIATFGIRLHDTIEDAVEDSFIVGTGVAIASVTKMLGSASQSHFIADARPEIDKAVQRAADKRKALLRLTIKALPNVMVQRGRGAPPKSQRAREQESKDYAAKVEAAYRKLRIEKKRKPTKISVARELGEGGINPKTYGESSAQAFRKKLDRLKLNYDEIADKVEKELNSNS